jgi:hypothetical protein
MGRKHVIIVMSNLEAGVDWITDESGAGGTA